VPTLLSLPIVPLALATELGKDNINGRLTVVGLLASILPDIDVISFRLGIPYAHPFGHRGTTHSLAFAVLIALLAVACATRLNARRWIAAVFVFLAAASHPLLDMLTDGGRSVALFWPVSNERYFFPAQMIAVSTLDWRRFFSPAGLTTLVSEIPWVWLPGGMMALGLMLCRSRIIGINLNDKAGRGGSP